MYDHADCTIFNEAFGLRTVIRPDKTVAIAVSPDAKDMLEWELLKVIERYLQLFDVPHKVYRLVDGDIHMIEIGTPLQLTGNV
jgi:hypothetical protein